MDPSKNILRRSNILAIFNFAMTLLGIYLVSFDKKTHKYKIGYLKIIYHLVVLGLILWALYTQASHFWPNKDADINYVLVKFYPMIAGHVVSFFLVLSYSVTLKRFIRMLNDSTFRDIFFKLDQSALKRAYNRQAALLSLFSVIYVGSEIVMSLRKANFDFHGIISHDFVLFNLASTTQFYLSMFAIEILLTYLIDQLKEIGKDASKEKCTWEKGDMESVWKIFQTYNRKNGVGGVSDDMQGEMAEEILMIRRGYHELYKFSIVVTEVNQFRIALLVLHHTIMLIIHFYTLLRNTIDVLTWTWTGEEPLAFDFLKCLVLSLASIMWVIIPTTKAQKQMQLTSYTVQDIITKSTIPAVVDELELFSLQILQERISVSPFGMFDIANKLLLSSRVKSAIGSGKNWAKYMHFRSTIFVFPEMLLSLITSYLVILLQYKAMTDGLRANNMTIPNDRPRSPRRHFVIYFGPGPHSRPHSPPPGGRFPNGDFPRPPPHEEDHLPEPV